MFRYIFLLCVYKNVEELIIQNGGSVVWQTCMVDNIEHLIRRYSIPEATLKFHASDSTEVTVKINISISRCYILPPSRKIYNSSTV
jgi:hypothetical protein